MKVLDWFTRHLWLKLASVVIAFALWFYARADQTYTLEFALPVETSGLSEGLVLMEMPPRSALVTMRGQGKSFIPFFFRSPVVRIDLSGVKLTTRSVAVSASDVELPGSPEITVEAVSPSEIEIWADRISQKEVSVLPETTGTAKKGYVVADITKDVNLKVVLRGPSRIISPYKSVHTEPVKLKGKSESFTVRTKLLSPSEKTVVTPESVDVLVRIEEEEEREVEAPVTIWYQPEGAVILKTKRVRIKLKGAVSVLEKMKPPRVVADLRKLGTGIHKVELKTHVSTGVTVTRVEPSVIEVEIR